ncbi:ty3-gypsy retrotransposon protein [Tanacetum coccineum]
MELCELLQMDEGQNVLSFVSLIIDLIGVYPIVPIPKEARFSLQPSAVLDQKLVKRRNRAAMKVLVQWKGQTTQDATWEFLDFSELTSCGQEVGCLGNGNGGQWFREDKACVVVVVLTLKLCEWSYVIGDVWIDLGMSKRTEEPDWNRELDRNQEEPNWTGIVDLIEDDEIVKDMKEQLEKLTGRDKEKQTIEIDCVVV